MKEGKVMMDHNGFENRMVEVRNLTWSSGTSFATFLLALNTSPGSP
jgi:hypothetical protein